MDDKIWDPFDSAIRWDINHSHRISIREEYHHGSNNFDKPRPMDRKDYGLYRR